MGLFSDMTGLEKPEDLLSPGTATKKATLSSMRGAAKAFSGGKGGSISADADVRPTGHSGMQEMLWNQPGYEDTVYGPGGYDPSKFGYEREDYDPNDIQGYDPTKLGGVGYEVGGYDVAERGGLQGYDPTEVQAMNFDPYRRNNLQDVSATSASGQASAEGALARSGGMSTADRMAMASQFNRDKIAGRSQVLGQTDELEAGNRFQVGMENARAQTGADKYLAGQQNQGMFTDQRLQTDANRYGSDASNRASEINAAAQTESDRRRGEMQDEVRMQNTTDQNAYNKSEAGRKYQESGDLYGGQVDDWTTRGQVLAGNPNLDYGPKPKPKPKPLWERPRSSSAGSRTWGSDKDKDKAVGQRA